MKTTGHFKLLVGLFTAAMPLHSVMAESTVSHHKQTYQHITLGDSISAGFLGFTQVASDAVRGQSSGLEELPPPNVWRGIRYPWLVESKSRWSWTTGRSSNSIVRRLIDWFGPRTPIRIRVLNYAESGGVTAHIPRQARLAMRHARTRPWEPVELVTIMVGANDACERVENSKEEADSIRRSMARTFQVLAETANSMNKKPLKVFVSSVPNIPELGAKKVLKHEAFRGITCEAIRNNVAGFCAPLLKWSTAQEFQARVERVRFVNEALESAVIDAQARYPKLSVHFDWSFAEFRQRPDLLAADCFHPGRRGQKQLAERMWNAMPWYSEPDHFVSPASTDEALGSHSEDDEEILWTTSEHSSSEYE